MGSPESLPSTPVDTVASQSARSFIIMNSFFESSVNEKGNTNGSDIRVGGFLDGGTYTITRHGIGNEATYDVLWDSKVAPHVFQAVLKKDGLNKFCIYHTSPNAEMLKIKELSVDNFSDEEKLNFRAQGDNIANAVADQLNPFNLRIKPHPLTI